MPRLKNRRRHGNGNRKDKDKKGKDGKDGGDDKDVDPLLAMPDHATLAAWKDETSSQQVSSAQSSSDSLSAFPDYNTLLGSTEEPSDSASGTGANASLLSGGHIGGSAGTVPKSRTDKASEAEGPPAQLTTEASKTSATGAPADTTTTEGLAKTSAAKAPEKSADPPKKQIAVPSKESTMAATSGNDEKAAEAALPSPSRPPRRRSAALALAAVRAAAGVGGTDSPAEDDPDDEDVVESASGRSLIEKKSPRGGGRGRGRGRGGLLAGGTFSIGGARLIAQARNAVDGGLIAPAPAPPISVTVRGGGLTTVRGGIVTTPSPQKAPVGRGAMTVGGIRNTTPGKKDDADDDDIAIVHVELPKHPRKSTRRVAATIDLMMECVDDELSPWQKAASKQAEVEYREALQKIKLARAGNAVIQQAPAGYVPPAPVIAAKPIAPAAPPPPPLPPPPAPTAAAPPVRVRARGNKSSDIIVIDDESPPTSPPRPAVPVQKPKVGNQPLSQAQLQQLLFSQPIITQSGQRVILPQQPLTQYKIVTTSVPQQTNLNSQNPALSGLLNRSPTTIPVQRVAAQPRKQNIPAGAVVRETPTVVSGTMGLGVKRPATVMENELAKAKKKRPSTDGDDPGNWVPLDEYYYGKKEGDPAYREEKGEFRFKCWYCHKMLYNNVRIMMHMQGHIDSEKQQNLDLSDLTQCKHCYKQFDTPFEMQTHVEKVHQKGANVLVCRICEKDHENQQALRAHMKTTHNACEMPYICQLCNFRSSIYSDVVDHFKKRHDSSQYVMCLYCLRVFKVNFSKSNGWGLTQNYYQHLQKHQLKNSAKKCPHCKLNFLNKNDVKLHKGKDHMPNHKGILGLGGSTLPAKGEQVMIKVPEEGIPAGGLSSSKANKAKAKSLNAPAVSKVQEMRGMRLTKMEDLYCIECKNPMELAGHFKKYVECSMCRYATICNHAYSNHMIGFHSGLSNMRLLMITKERQMERPMFCSCGYTSKYGNAIANHLVSCSKRTCYSKKPEIKWFEYNAELEEFNPFEPYMDEPDTPEKPEPLQKEMSLFDVLGLRKKPASNTGPRRVFQGEKRKQAAVAKEVAASIMDDVLDASFPAETAASAFISTLMDNVHKEIKMKEEIAMAKVPAPSNVAIPSFFTGQRKWSTVKIKTSKTPTKSSIFLGSGSGSDKDDDDEKSVDSQTKPESLHENEDTNESSDKGSSKGESLEAEPDEEDKSSRISLETKEEKEEMEDVKKGSDDSKKTVKVEEWKEKVEDKQNEEEVELKQETKEKVEEKCEGEQEENAGNEEEMEEEPSGDSANPLLGEKGNCQEEWSEKAADVEQREEEKTKEHMEVEDTDAPEIEKNEEEVEADEGSDEKAKELAKQKENEEMKRELEEMRQLCEETEEVQQESDAPGAEEKEDSDTSKRETEKQKEHDDLKTDGNKEEENVEDGLEKVTEQTNRQSTEESEDQSKKEDEKRSEETKESSKVSATEKSEDKETEKKDSKAAEKHESKSSEAGEDKSKAESNNKRDTDTDVQKVGSSSGSADLKQESKAKTENSNKPEEKSRSEQSGSRHQERNSGDHRDSYRSDRRDDRGTDRRDRRDDRRDHPYRQGSDYHHKSHDNRNHGNYGSRDDRSYQGHRGYDDRHWQGGGGGYKDRSHGDRHGGYNQGYHGGGYRQHEQGRGRGGYDHYRNDRRDYRGRGGGYGNRHGYY